MIRWLVLMKRCAVPKPIENDAELNRYAELSEKLSFQPDPTPEEELLGQLLVLMIEDYDRRVCPEWKMNPLAMMKFLMEQRELRQRDLIPVFGSSSVASAVFNRKRAISKAQARKLAGFFHVSADLFI
jgi:HTH-type transcriptional regulator / antitoxin HigA